MKKYLKILRECPLFRQISDDDLMKMLVCLDARVESFDKKYTIIAEGNPAKYVGIVLTGSIQIVRIDYYGNRSILSELGSGQVFGEAFACAGVPTVPVTVIAEEPCDIMLIDCSHILHTCSNYCAFHQQLIFNLMKDLAEKTILFHQKLEIASKRTTREKLMTYLMFQAKKAGTDRFQIPFDRQELAD
ncbi:MAG: Crp/Fnr family transcriptional regulator, partial [Clostridia bacterium]|nr:Crp/Fnr family transcriptional regulator [Clostridia bacterium]